MAINAVNGKNEYDSNALCNLKKIIKINQFKLIGFN